MLAIGRALMAKPKLLLLDEPSMGLAPKIVEQILENIRAINQSGVTVLLVEQNAAMALAISHRIRNISWRVTQGPLGARLELALWPERALPARRGPSARVLHSWRFTPEMVPCLSLVPLCGGAMAEGNELFGAFDSLRKARNAIQRIAIAERVCHTLLGLGNSAGPSCPGCAGNGGLPGCEHGTGRLAHLTRAYGALRGIRVPAWPYRGPIAVRERRAVYIFDQWQYLGTARTLSDIGAVLETRVREFDAKIFRLLVKTLPRLPAKRIVPLAPRRLIQDLDVVLRAEMWPE